MAYSIHHTHFRAGINCNCGREVQIDESCPCPHYLNLHIENSEEILDISHFATLITDLADTVITETVIRGNHWSHNHQWCLHDGTGLTNPCTCHEYGRYKYSRPGNMDATIVFES